MKINYPIMYALMPIKEQTSCRSENYDTICYIVSKCYLVGKKTMYSEDGKSSSKYEVVFPYKKSDFTWKYQSPSYNGYQYTNSDYVDMVFDSYEDTVNYKNEVNKKLYNKDISILEFNDGFNKQASENKKQFYDRLSTYELLEKQILANVSMMNNDRRKELDNVISSDGKTLQANLYQFISIFNNSEYLVYSIPRKYYNNFDDESLGKIKASATPILLGTSSISRLINGNTNGCYYLDNNRLNYSKKIQPVSTDEIKNISNNATIIYTTETVDDIIDSYNNYTEIDLVELNKNRHKQKIKSNTCV